MKTNALLAIRLGLILIGCDCREPSHPQNQTMAPVQTQPETAAQNTPEATPAPAVSWMSWGEEVKGMRCRITCDKRVYSPSEPITITCRVANRSPDEIMVGQISGGYINLMSHDFSVDFILTDGQGKKVSGQNSSIRGELIKTKSIKPGQDADIVTVNIRDWHQALPDGEYTLQAVCLRRHMEADSENISWSSNKLPVTITAGQTNGIKGLKEITPEKIAAFLPGCRFYSASGNLADSGLMTEQVLMVSADGHTTKEIKNINEFILQAITNRAVLMDKNAALMFCDLLCGVSHPASFMAKSYGGYILTDTCWKPTRKIIVSTNQNRELTDVNYEFSGPK